MRIGNLKVLLVVLGAACGGGSGTPPTGGDATELKADQIYEGLSHRMTRGGILVAVLNADTAYFHEEERRFDMVGMQLEFYNEAGVAAGTLTSRTGEYKVQEEELVARGDAVLTTRTDEGERRLETDELFYNVPSDRLWSNQPFVMTEDGRVTRGARFQSDGRFGTWEVTGGKTEGGLPEEGGITF